jgi:aspartate kinase
VTSGLLALALHKRDIPARSWMGWQVPIMTDHVHGKARIQSIDADKLKKNMMKGEVAVIAGFQGVTDDDRITTLGRGGSDTSAVAVAAALKADRCDIYTDVQGVYTADPRIVNRARKIDKISYEEMLEMASVGAKVLQTRSVELAMKERVPVQVLSSFESASGSDLPGTLVVDEENIVEQEVVSGITHSRDEAKVTLRHLPDVPGVAAKVFGGLADAAVNVDMIVQNLSADHKKTDITFTVPRADLPKAVEVLKEVSKTLPGTSFESSADVAKISIIGIGMRSHVGVAQRMFKTLAEKGINIQVITTSEIKVSVLISEEYTELAVRSLHTAYGLDHGS